MKKTIVLLIAILQFTACKKGDTNNGKGNPGDSNGIIGRWLLVETSYHALVGNDTSWHPVDKVQQSVIWFNQDSSFYCSNNFKWKNVNYKSITSMILNQVPQLFLVNDLGRASTVNIVGRNEIILGVIEVDVYEQEKFVRVIN